MSDTRRDHHPRQRPAGRQRAHAAAADRVPRRLGRRRHALRAGRGQRRRPPARAHGVQGHRPALGPRHRRGDRARRRQPERLHLARAHRLLRPHPGRRRRRSPPTSWPTSCGTRPSTRPSWRRSATSSCRRSARSRTRPTTSSSTCCRRRPTPTSRWAAPSSARRRSSQGMPREALIDYMARHYGPKRLVFAGAGKIEHARLVDLAQRLFGDLPATDGGRGRAGPLQRRHEDRAAPGPRAGPSVHGRRGPALSPSRPLRAAGAVDRAGRRHVLAPVPGGAREPRPVLLDLLLRLGLCRHRPARRLCRHRPRGRARADAGRRRRDARPDRGARPRTRSPAPAPSSRPAC